MAQSDPEREWQTVSRNKPRPWSFRKCKAKEKELKIDGLASCLASAACKELFRQGLAFERTVLESELVALPGDVRTVKIQNNQYGDYAVFVPAQNADEDDE